MTYKILVTRNEPHPKAGERMPAQYRNFDGSDTYPLTASVEVLNCELTEEMWAAVRNACIEAAK